MKRSRPEEDVAKAASGKRAAATTTSGSSGATAKRAKKGTAFGDQLARMVDNPLCADVELLVGQEGTSVYASKVILVARSPVFEALLGGNFREGQPPTSSSSSASSSSSSVATSSSEASSSSSLAPVFWHWAEIGDMEPRTMRHLLHCLYTDQLHPDLVTPPSPAPSSSAQAEQKTDDDGDKEDEGNDEDSPMTQQERDLVALFVAADCYLVDKAQTLVRRELVRRFSNGDYSNVLPVFDQALALAPELATRACQPVIEARAKQILVDRDDAMEARWLGLSDTAAARVVGMDLEAIDEIYLFRAIQRRYEHHFAEAMGPADDDDSDGDDEGKDNSDEKKRKEEGMKKKREAAIAGAKKKVAGLIKGIKTSLLSVNELSGIVEPSGLFTDAQLVAAYRNAALTHRYVIEDLSVSPAHSFHDVQAHGNIRWSLGVHRTNATEHTVYFRIKPGTEISPRLPDLSAEGVKFTIYCDRRVQTFSADASTVVSVPGALELAFTAQHNSGRVTIIIRVPPTAFTKAAR
jgi:hypothetical protein